MPDNKVALFIDFDNIRIGIRQHFGGELHPQKLMNKAAKYGRVVTAKAYADFTGHPKEFQDRLLFAAGIEPIHAPSKISGGRRQSSADMHMVIDMFLEAIDNPDVDTFILMTGDADFVRMVATLRRRFGRKVVVSGVQSTSTSLDLMNAADARDPITRQDCDMTGELGRMTRPLVTRADLDAQQAAAEEEALRPKKRGGLFGGLFKKKEPTGAEATITPPPALPAPPAAPRRLRATELRGGRATPAPAPTRARAATRPASQAGRSGTTAGTTSRRGRQAPELPPVGPDSQPDDFEKKLIKEVFTMPPGRSGFKTIKTIEETLRSKAGQLGGTRKEVPTRLERLEAMGIFKRETRSRGAVEVPAGELVLDHPVVKEITAGLSRPEAKERQPRSPRRARPAASETRVGAAVAEATAETAAGDTDAETAAAESAAAAEAESPGATEAGGAEAEATDAAEAAATDARAEAAPAEPEVTPEPAVTPEPEAAPKPEAPGMPFRWVTGAPATPEPAGAAEKAPADAEKAKPAAKRTSRRSTGTKAKAKSSRTTKKQADDEVEDDSSSDAEAVDTNKEPTPA